MKRLITMALSLTLALSLTACGGVKTDAPKTGAPQTENPTPAKPQEKSQLEAVKAAGKLVIGTSADYPPYEFHETKDGKDIITGWEMDLAKQIATDLGVELEIKDLSFEGLIGDLNAKKIDMAIAAMTIDEDRSKSVDFSTPYWKGGQVLLMKKEAAANFKGPEDLKGKTIGVQLGTTGEAAAKNIEGAKVKPLDKFEGAILDLMTGRVDAVACDYTVGKNYEKNQDLKIVHEMTSEETGIAFRKGDSSLRDEVNKTLERLIKEDAIAKMVQAYTIED